MSQVVTTTPTNTRSRGRGVADCYLRFCAAHLSEMRRHVAARHFNRLRRIARVLQGNTARLGLTQLARLGRQLEADCDARNLLSLRGTYAAIAHTLLLLCRGRPIPVDVTVGPPPPVKRFPVTRKG